jgi:hypothetical protein
VALEGSTPFFSPSLASGPGGSVAVVAYRVRSGGRADVVAATSSDRGVRWRRRLVRRPFSLSRAPRTLGGQRYLGAPGVAATPDGFAAAAVAGRDVVFKPLAPAR